MKNLIKVLGYIFSFGSGILMLLFWLDFLIKWVGVFWGVIIGIFISPAIVIFPFLFWIIEGIFPVFYFLLWGIGIIGMFLMGITSKD
ncbi:MAG: hypothetical protein PHU35_01850 [Bacteroidales bacterium]|jgi:hypothetical protein|nr:hypothetical protein [Bacteroidales bacterium]